MRPYLFLKIVNNNKKLVVRLEIKFAYISIYSKNFSWKLEMQRKTSFNFKFLCRRLYIVLFENMSCQSELELVLLSTTVVPQPLRRLITQIGFGDKILKLKRYRVFDQIFFENICRQAFFLKKVVLQPLIRLITPLRGVFRSNPS